MKITFSDFVMLKEKGESRLSDTMYFAEVTVTKETGMLWWKKKIIERRKIARQHGSLWYFIDNGKFCPGFFVDELERGYKAKTKLGEL